MTKQWTLYEIHLNTKSGPLMTMAWGTSQRKALKNALKKLFKTRGIKFLWLNNREFDDPARLITYINKNKLLDTICKPCANQILKRDQASARREIQQ